MIARIPTTMSERMKNGCESADWRNSIMVYGCAYEYTSRVVIVPHPIQISYLNNTISYEDIRHDRNENRPYAYRVRRGLSKSHDVLWYVPRVSRTHVVHRYLIMLWARRAREDQAHSTMRDVIILSEVVLMKDHRSGVTQVQQRWANCMNETYL